MIIGIPKEIKNNEYRVGLMPKHVNELSKKNEVLVQSSAGTGSSFTDNDLSLIHISEPTRPY